MNIVKARKILPILAAWVEGKELEFRFKDEDVWQPVKEDVYSEGDTIEYRVKPGYRAFKDGSECYQEMLKHEPIGWVTHKNSVNHPELITSVGGEYMYFSQQNWRYKDAFSYLRFVDGTPFGIADNE
jgi:hypothetical protein